MECKLSQTLKSHLQKTLKLQKFDVVLRLEKHVNG